MTMQLLRPPAHGLNVLVAEGEHQDNVHNALYAELARGAVLPATGAKFRAAITDLVARGAEVIVLACTEFGILVQAEDGPVPVIDTTIARAQAAVEGTGRRPSAVRHLNRCIACNAPGRDHPPVLPQRSYSLQPPPGRSHRTRPECALT
jgi:hypothetical protein